MEQSTLLSNDQIVFIYERLLWDEIVGGMALDGEKQKLQSLLDKINNSKPVVREITTAITAGIVDSLKRTIEEFESAQSEAGANYKRITDVVATLSTAYYAITGKRKEDVIDRIKSDDNLRKTVREIMENHKLR